MGAPRYPQEAKDRALGALMASAVFANGVWIPNLLGTSKVLSIPEATLRRWWNERDRGEDDDLRRAVTRERDQVRQEGAASLLQRITDGAVQICDYILHPIHRSTELVILESSEDEPVVVARVAGVRPDHMAKALELLVRLRPQIAAMLGEGKAEGSVDPLSNAREAAARTRLIGTLKASSGG